MRPLIVIGTRPEAIKLAPVARALPEADVMLTGQHPVEMVVPTLEYFGVPIAEKRNHIAGLDLPQSFAQTFGWLASRVRGASCVIGQGDTTTAAAAAQVAFYAGVPFVHVEAGLRTYNATPYPEEFNRRICALAATVHCCPTERAAENLRSERVGGRIEVTGNTVVDALLWTTEREAKSPTWQEKYAHLGDRLLVLVTCHRRENHGFHIESLADSISANTGRGVAFLWAVHPNNAARPTTKLLPGILIEPPPYDEWAWLLNRASLILTDSGGIQEEAAILGKPCYVLRETTERREAVECGACRLIDFDTIEGKLREFISDRMPVDPNDPLGFAAAKPAWPIGHHPFGDGKSGERIANIVRELTNTEPCQPLSALTATP